MLIHDKHAFCVPCLGVAHAFEAIDGSGTCFSCRSYDTSKKLSRYQLALAEAKLPPSGTPRRPDIPRISPPGSNTDNAQTQRRTSRDRSPRGGSAHTEGRRTGNEATPYAHAPPSVDSYETRPKGFKGHDSGKKPQACHAESSSPAPKTGQPMRRKHDGNKGSSGYDATSSAIPIKGTQARPARVNP